MIRAVQQEKQSAGIRLTASVHQWLRRSLLKACCETGFVIRKLLRYSESHYDVCLTVSSVNVIKLLSTTAQRYLGRHIAWDLNVKETEHEEMS